MARLYTHGLADNNGFTTNDGLWIPTFFFSSSGDIDQTCFHEVVAQLRHNKDKYNIDTVVFKPQRMQFEITLTDGRVSSQGAEVVFLEAILAVVKKEKPWLDRVQTEPRSGAYLDESVIINEAVEILTDTSRRS